VHSGAQVSPLVSGASGGQDRRGRPAQHGWTTPIKTEASVAGQCPGAGVPDGILVLLAPVPPATAANSNASASPARRGRRTSGCVVS